jgi:hypothetical protein
VRGGQATRQSGSNTARAATSPSRPPARAIIAVATTRVQRSPQIITRAPRARIIHSLTPPCTLQRPPRFASLRSSAAVATSRSGRANRGGEGSAAAIDRQGAREGWSSTRWWSRSAGAHTAPRTSSSTRPSARGNQTDSALCL